MKVHSSPKAATMGVAVSKSGELRQQHNRSSKWCKSIWCLLDEEWWDIEDVSGTALSGCSLQLVPQDEKGEDVNPKGGPYPHGHPWGQYCLHTSDGACYSNGNLHLHGEGSRNGCSVCVNCDCFNGDPEFGGPSVAVGCQGAIVEELAEEDLAEGCPWMCNSSLPIFLEELCT